ncbi:MAG: UvrD-helicase domain-containing protein [Candidatus Latescibacterota bacterium]|nr:UvrD-helicase domain-containing protein [Candidatus Latescibacterota bacterium]
MSLLSQLNPSQRDAVETTDGPLLILAGAGSGKTRVLTYRIAYLINQLGVAPWNILAVTFTNKAAGELKDRTDQLVGSKSKDIWTGTFHSICARILRYEADNFGLDRNFTIYDETDRRSAMRRIFEIHNINLEEITPRSVISQISKAKNSMLSPTSFASDGEDTPSRKLISELYTSYQADLHRNNALDFDDLLIETVRRFDANPSVMSSYQNRFLYTHVDEYQDTNRPQYMLCRQWSGNNRNLCVVGDDDQSIYKFRGAELRNILDFEQDYADAKIIRLEQNYRSTGRILRAANEVISRNKNRKGKTLWTKGNNGDLIDVVECDSDRREAKYIVRTMRQQISSSKYTSGQMAVLYRTNAQSRPLEEELQKSGIPYTIVGGTRFYERREIKDILSFMRLLMNPADDIGLMRIINTPRRGIGQTSINHLQRYARANNLNLFETLNNLENINGLNSRSVNNLKKFHEIMIFLQKSKNEVPLPKLGRLVFERSGYEVMLKEDRSQEAESRVENVEQLIAFMGEHEETNPEANLLTFLEEVALMSPEDDTSNTNNTITLMTVHSAKGLEYPMIFVTGLEENLFPTARAVEESHENTESIEEERRLFYVGITRACDRLVLTHANQRYAYGNLIDCIPSRFLKEIPEELVSLHQELSEINPKSRQSRQNRFENKQQTYFQRPGKITRKKTNISTKGVHYEWDEGSQVSFGDIIDQDDFLAVGQWVRHANWGRGQIVAREGTGDKMKVSVQFGPHIKKIAVAFAQLEPG